MSESFPAPIPADKPATALPEGAHSPKDGSGGPGAEPPSGPPRADLTSPAVQRRVLLFRRDLRARAATAKQISSRVKPDELELELELGIKIWPKTFFAELAGALGQVADFLETLPGGGLA